MNLQPTTDDSFITFLSVWVLNLTADERIQDFASLARTCMIHTGCQSPVEALELKDLVVCERLSTHENRFADLEFTMSFVALLKRAAQAYLETQPVS